jgi:spore maturation protein SpmA
MINIIWGGMFLIAVLVAFFKLAIEGNVECFNQIVQAIFNSASSAVDISIGLIGILSFWLGILRLIEKTGIAETISHKLSPLFRIIMKDIPSDSPAISTVVLNMSANFLGLDNAATPMGLKAMEQLQELNPKKDTASNAQILFMVINASAVTLIPITILMYRAELGASNPAAVFIPILFSVENEIAVASIMLTRSLFR